MKTHCNENNFEFIIFDPKDKKFYIEDEKNSGLNLINFTKYLDSNKTNNVTNYIFINEDELNIIKIPLYANEITKSDLKNIYDYINDLKDKKLNFIGKFGKEKKEKSEAKKERFEIKKEINFNNLINDNYIIYAKDKNKNKTIFFNKKYFCNQYQDIDVFYVFDASINLNKKGNNQNNNNSDNIKNNTIIDNSNLYKNVENNNNLMGNKRKRNINKEEELEEWDEWGDEMEKENDESSKK